MDKNREPDVVEAEEIRLRVNEDELPGDGVLPGAHTAKVMAGQIQRFMPDADDERTNRQEANAPSQRVRDDIRKKLNLVVPDKDEVEEEPEEPKQKKTFDAESRKLLGVAFMSSVVASVLVLFTYYGLREIRHQREDALWRQLSFTPNTSSSNNQWDLDDRRLWSSQGSLFGLPTENPRPQIVPDDGEKVLATPEKVERALKRIEQLKGLGHAGVLIEREMRMVVALGPDAIAPLLSEFTSTTSSSATIAAEILARFGSLATGLVSTAIRNNPYAPAETYVVQAGINGIRSMEMILLSSNSTQDDRERAVKLMSRGLASLQTDDSGPIQIYQVHHVAEELVKVYDSTKDDIVRADVVACLQYTDRPGSVMIDVLEDAVKRHIPNADAVLDTLVERRKVRDFDI